jgi:hypothetical protein
MIDRCIYPDALDMLSCIIASVPSNPDGLGERGIPMTTISDCVSRGIKTFREADMMFWISFVKLAEVLRQFIWSRSKHSQTGVSDT